ncbi:MAG: hypothetical protein V4858_09900 [Pseudomonadota bacterium]
MTKHRIVVSLATDHMSIDIMRPIRGKGLHQAWQRWSAYLQGDDAPHHSVMKSITVRGDTSMQGLAILFQKGLDAIKKSTQHVLDGASLEVVLGPSLAHVGILEMITDGAVKWSETDRNAFVEAWVSQTWAVQPADCMVRAVPVDHSGRHLVTSIERYVVETIASLCAQEAIRLSSCKPALAVHIASLVNQGEGNTPSDGADDGPALNFEVFVERGLDGKRSSIVQFLVLRGCIPLSLTRMWLPEEDEEASNDGVVAQTINRLRAQHRSSGVPRVHIVGWPRTLTEAGKT